MNSVPRAHHGVTTSQNFRVDNGRSCTCRFCEGVMHVLRWFPTPMALDATLRLLTDKVSSLFGRLVPYALPTWGVASYWHFFGLLAVSGMLFLAPSNNCDEMEDVRRAFLFEAGMVIAIVAHTILQIGKTNMMLLSHFSSLTGQLTLWKGLLFEIRNGAFLASFYLAAEGSTNCPLELFQDLFSMGVVAVSAASGYSTLVGVLATIAASLGVYQFLSEG
jgi:hypothetical protein